MYTVRTAVSAGALACALIFATGAAAQNAPGVVKTKGLMLGAHVNGSSVSYEGDDSDNGGGGGVMGGWGFNRWFMLYAGVDGARVKFKNVDIGDPDAIAVDDEEFTLAHLDVGARFSFPSASHGWAPYLNAAFTYRAATAEIEKEDYTLSGPAFTVGGGIQYFFNPKFAIDAGVQFSRGKFNRFEGGGVTIDLDEFTDVKNSNSARVNVGVKYYPHFGGK